MATDTHDRTAEEAYLPRFGLTRFRPGQQEVVRAILQGRDCLCIMPTGGGKSLCYQLPSLLRDGTTLVVSPLIALMKDQVDALVARGIRASFINSSLNLAEQGERLACLARREYDLIYVAPERFRSRRFTECLRQANIQLLAVDEAHCISEWGHDFRHDYARLGEYRQRIGQPQTIALTATATEEVRKDIATQLQLRDPLTLVAGFSRPNLRLGVCPCDDNRAKRRELIRLLRRTPGSGIIYASTRRACESIAAEIADVAGRRIVTYHGGIDADERRRTQEMFMSGEAPIAVATNAFGMGIDKADVRFVVHYNFPGSIEAYYQEAGRAGRDGETAECLLLYMPSDQAIHRFFIESAYPERAVVRAVYEYLRNHADDPVEMTQQQLKEALGLKISNEGIGTCERLLEKAHALERLEPHRNMAIVRIHGDLPSFVDMLPRQAATQRQVLQHAERYVQDRRDEDVFFHPSAWAAELQITPAALTRTLRELVKLDAFDYVPSFRGRAVRVIRRDQPFESLKLDFEQLEQRKAADYRKLNRVINLFHAKECRQSYILKYFGDPSASPCGTCDRCNATGHAASATVSSADAEDGPADYLAISVQESPEIHHAIRILLSGVARANDRVGKHLIVGMLAGSQAAKIRRNQLDRLSTFGMLAHLTQTEIASLFDGCLELGWLHQNEIERFRPVAQLTETGSQVMRDTHAPDVQIRILATAARKLQRRHRRPGVAPGSPASTPMSTIMRPDARHEPVRPDHADRASDATWTSRVLLAGFTVDECADIRRLPREQIIQHALEALDAGLELDPKTLFSQEQRSILEQRVSQDGPTAIEPTPSSQSHCPDPRDVLLFTRSGGHP